MRRNSLLVLSVFIVLVQAGMAQAGREPPGRRVLIGFRADSGPRTPNERAEMVRQGGGAVHGAFHLVPVVAAHLPEPALEKLKTRREIEYIEDDVVLYAVGQTEPWGVDRIDADLAWPTGNTGQGVKVAVLDTGIDYDHPDLGPAGGVNYAGSESDGSTSPSVWDDKHGHGTHIAGIIAARNDSTGVIGVAPDVGLWAVRVLGDDGSGYTSDVIQGLDWCVANGVQVAAMSLGGESTTSLESACDRAYSSGVLLVAAAGNGGGAVSYPAAYSSVIAVSATDARNDLAPFSNRGPQIELAAPGVGVYSTFKDGSYATMSGTSIACPHVAGAAALAWASGLASNTAVRDRLTTTAEDLGTPGFDDDFGYGLVNAQRAAGTAPEPTVASVRSITYGTKGGRLGDLHLLITLRVEDDLGRPVANASVVAFVSRNGGVYQAIADRTGPDGSVRLRIVRAASGSYETRVDSVAAEGLVWDGVTPANEFSK